MKDFPHPTSANLKAIARFRSAFDRATLSAGAWQERPGALPKFEGSQDVDELVNALYEHQFVVSIDWPGWAAHARRYFDDRSLIEDAPIGDVQRLFTTIVRADRFSEGSFSGHIATGLVAALLQRVEKLATEKR